MSTTAGALRHSERPMFQLAIKRAGGGPIRPIKPEMARPRDHRAAGDPTSATMASFVAGLERRAFRRSFGKRIGGPSEGADRMVATARRLGKTVFRHIGEIP
jgi:hypothetical protein